MTEPAAPFTPDDVMRLLADVCLPDASELPVERVANWLDDHVRGPRDAHVLLHTTAGAVATFADLSPGEDEMVALEVDPGVTPEPHILQSMQLIAAAANDDLDMLTALIVPIVRPEDGGAMFARVLVQLLKVFRAIYDNRAATDGASS